jgi:hypothetical protein
MQCEQAQQALIDALYGAEPVPEVRAHLERCAVCQAFRSREGALDRWLALDEPAVARPGFDTRFFARLETEKAAPRQRRRARWYWALVPLAASAALVFLGLPQKQPAAPQAAAEAPAADDLGIAMELELVENIAVVQKLDQVEDYELLSQLDEGELERIAQEVQ